jgi:hypothetical protein
MSSLDVVKVTGYFVIGGNSIPEGLVILPGYDHPILVAHHRADQYDGMPETVIEVVRETVDAKDRLKDQLVELRHEHDGIWTGQLILESYEGLPLRRLIVLGGQVVGEMARMSWPDGTVV